MNKISSPLNHQDTKPYLVVFRDGNNLRAKHKALTAKSPMQAAYQSVKRNSPGDTTRPTELKVFDRNTQSDMANRYLQRVRTQVQQEKVNQKMSQGKFVPNMPKRPTRPTVGTPITQKGFSSVIKRYSKFTY